MPIESLFDHLEAGISLDAFLDDFPSVSKDQAIALLDCANRLLNIKTLTNFMRLLPDENLPKRLKLDFEEHEIFTVRDKGWNGVKNGQLLKLLLENEFNALLTFDKNLQHQQNFTKYTLTVFVLSASINSYEELTKLSPKVKEYLGQEVLPAGAIVIAAD